MAQPRTGRLTAIRRGVRLAGKLLHGFILVGIVFPRIRPALREAVIGQWCREVLEILSIRVTVQGEIPPASVRSVLFVANHVSWLDVLTINAGRQVRFVANVETRRWPLIGWLAAKTGTLFLRRTSTRDTSRLAARMRSLLVRGRCLALFPESTTTIGTSVGSFHSGLFESAITASSTVWPVAIQYRDTDGTPAQNVGFIGEQSLLGSILAVLNCPSTEVCLGFAPPMESTGQDCGTLAHECRMAIERQLAGHGTIRTVPALPPFPTGQPWSLPLSAA